MNSMPDYLLLRGILDNSDRSEAECILEKCDYRTKLDMLRLAEIVTDPGNAATINSLCRKHQQPLTGKKK